MGESAKKEKGELRLIWFSAAICTGVTSALLIALVFLLEMPINWDCAVFLQCAKLLLEGNLPYVDYVELNPPMAHYFHILPLLLARGLGIDVPVAFQTMVLGLTLASSAAIYELMRRAQTIRSQAGRWLLLTAWVTFSVIVFADSGFGQREHLFVLAYLPWLYIREARHRQKQNIPLWLTLPIGLFSGVLTLMKPHFLAIALIVEGWMLYRTRRWGSLGTPEVILLMVIGLTYGTSLLAVAPLREAFFERWLPFIAENYDVYNRPFETVLFQPPPFGAEIWLVVIAALVLAFVVIGRDDDLSTLHVEMLLLALISGIGIYLLQRKGFSYHFYPVIGLLGLLLTTLATAFFEAYSGIFSRMRWCRVACVGVFFISLGALLLSQGQRAVLNAMTRQNYSGKYVEYIKEHTNQNDRVGFIDTSVRPAYPSLIIANRKPGIRYLAAFPLAMVYKQARYKRATQQKRGPFPYPRPEDMTHSEHLFREDLAQDIQQFRPEIVFVQSTSTCRSCPQGFNIDSYLRRTGWTEKHLEAYKPTEVVGQHLAYHYMR